MVEVGGLSVTIHGIKPSEVFTLKLVQGNKTNPKQDCLSTKQVVELLHIFRKKHVPAHSFDETEMVAPKGHQRQKFDTKGVEDIVEERERIWRTFRRRMESLTGIKRGREPMT